MLNYSPFSDAPLRYAQNDPTHRISRRSRCEVLRFRWFLYLYDFLFWQRKVFQVLSHIYFSIGCPSHWDHVTGHRLHTCFIFNKGPGCCRERMVSMEQSTLSVAMYTAWVSHTAIHLHVVPSEACDNPMLDNDRPLRQQSQWGHEKNNWYSLMIGWPCLDPGYTDILACFKGTGWKSYTVFLPDFNQQLGYV